MLRGKGSNKRTGFPCALSMYGLQASPDSELSFVEFLDMRERWGWACGESIIQGIYLCRLSIEKQNRIVGTKSNARKLKQHLRLGVITRQTFFKQLDT